MDVTAIIPLKAHSERLPGKNLGVLCGKPLFQWVINSLLEVPKISKIIVNVNDEESEEAVRVDCGDHVEVIMRPACLRGGEVTANDLIEWTLTQTGGDHFLYTHATNPMVYPWTFNRAIKEYLNAVEGRSLMGVTKHQIRLYDKSFRPINHDPHTITKSQDLEPVYVDNSCIYLFSRKTFAKYGRVSPDPIMFEMSKVESVDIDDHDDWKIAEALKTVEPKNYGN